jgi:hypothetical protein
MTTEPTTDTSLRTFRVGYVVTRSEYYEIAAVNDQEAKDKAFSDGQCIETRDTTHVDDFGIEEIPDFTPPSDYDRLRDAAGDLLDAAIAPELDAAHDKLSALLEDGDVSNDALRDAALALCHALNAHYERRRVAIATATPEDNTS